MLPPGQRRNKHDQRGLRQVEVGDERVRYLEAIARIDENIRPPGAGRHGAVLRRMGFQRAAAGGANADHTPAVFPCLVDELRRLLRYHAVFAVHGVVGDLLLLHRAEGAQTHMKCNVPNLYTHCLHSLQQLRREMQPRRGRCRRAVDLGVHRLIAFLILQLLLDVRRQGHLAQPLQHLQKDALIFEPHQPVAVRQLLHDLCRQLSVAEGHPCALPQLLSRTDKALPHVVAPIDEQQNFAGAAAGLPMPQQTRRQHPGIVQDQAVAGVQILRQVVEMPVLHRAGALVQHQKAGAVPPLQRRLGDQLLWKIKIEIMCFHVASLVYLRFACHGAL